MKTTLGLTAALFAAVAVAAAESAEPDQLELTMQAWCSQAGTLRGNIEVITAAGKSQRFTIVSRHSCTPDGQFHIVEEDFIAPNRNEHTVKVTFADRAINGFRTVYFSNGRQQEFRFEFVSVDLVDAHHWTQTIASPASGETYEGRPAVLRYTRERKGEQIISRKTVRFLDGPDEFVTRSVIEQRRSAPGPDTAR